jgi:hypothetical protein
MLKSVVAVSLFLTWPLSPSAQVQDDPGVTPVGPGSWQAHPAMRRVQAVVGGGGAVWAGTDGGLYRYEPASGEIKRFTTVEGLANLDVRSLAFDERRGVVWIGYRDGVIDRLEPASGDVRSFFDIARADRYPQRGINRIRALGDSLLIATDFGVVVFDAARGEVRDTYDRFGSLDQGIPTYDLLPAPHLDGSPGFWVATRDGVAYARRDAPNLRAPSAWVVDPLAPGPALALAHFGGRMYLGKERVDGSPDAEGDVRRREGDGSWVREHVSGFSVFDILVEPTRMTALSWFGVGVFKPDGGRQDHLIEGASIMISGGIGPDGGLWLGDRVHGLAELPALPTSGGPISPLKFIVPPGPLTNTILAVDAGGDGSVVVGYMPFGDLINGMGRFNGSTWTNFSTLTGHQVAAGGIRAVKLDSRRMAWGGSEGGGLMRVDPTGDITVFQAHNSTLRGEPGLPHYIVVPGIDEDRSGRIWVTNQQAPEPLHVWSPDDGWTGVPRLSAAPASARYGPLHIDSFDQKWAVLQRSGFIVARTNSADPTDAESIAVTGTGSAATGTGLPDQNVRAIVQDLDGRVWIGTERGLAVVFSPGSVFANPALAQPTWARTPDQTSYFLRDLNIFSMAVDPGGRKWIGSSSGVFVVNAAGNAVEAHFTPENSPLPSATVVDLSVDGSTGMVWFATDAGLMSYRGVSVDPSRRAETLRVYPNPYNPERDPFVRVEGLVAETRIRVLTADGQVVAAFDGRGGTATWDGRDHRTGQFVPSGVYIVAAAGLNGEGAAYGKIAVIR